MRDSDLLNSPAVPGKCQACDTPVEFTIIKSRAMTLSRSPHCRSFSRAVLDEKSLSTLFPTGGEQWLQVTGALLFHAQIMT